MYHPNLYIMYNKDLLALIYCLFMSAIVIAQNRNPFESVGKKGKILTLSKGHYEELFDQEDVQQIGTALVDIRQMKVVKLLTEQEGTQRLAENAINSRFLSVDPLAKGYPWYTPYQFAGNNPVKYVDLDGGEPGYSYRNEYGVVVTVPAGDNLQRRVPPEHLKYLPDGSAAGQRNFALEFTVGAGAPAALAADAGTGFTVTRTMLNVATVVTAANMASNMHESGNAKNPATKQELEHQAKAEAAELATQWMAGKFLNVAGQAIKSVPLVLSKGSRLKMFYDRLNTAAPVDNPKDVIKLINNTLDDVEDAYSGIKKARGIPDRDDGRMYGILDEKFVTTLEDGTTQALTKGHKVLIKENGSFTIQERKTGKIVLEKSGKE
ncbi:MAG: hypothetical protein E6Q24_21235 [Chitinophagaceae bacterium]|nr:MAG: hypothetical protein E6Q24_21235 [Chitinophagaceae bacterium]